MKRNKYFSPLRLTSFAACGLAFYALLRWKKSEEKLQVTIGYLKEHVQYHKDNNIPFGK
jgi:hypothetical protein